MIRIGHGYDSHRFGEGLELTLGGVKIPHCRGLAGHSDADAVLHALTDAILGAIAAGDIGQHFSDKDPKWKGAASQKFVEYAVSHAAEKGFIVVNCDITIITETPKIAPHKDSMRQNIANMLGVAAERVSVKGKTNEGMGFVGRGEGLVAEAVVLLANATIAGMIGK